MINLTVLFVHHGGVTHGGGVVRDRVYALLKGSGKHRGQESPGGTARRVGGGAAWDPMGKLQLAHWRGLGRRSTGQGTLSYSVMLI